MRRFPSLTNARVCCCCDRNRSPDDLFSDEMNASRKVINVEDSKKFEKRYLKYTTTHGDFPADVKKLNVSWNWMAFHRAAQLAANSLHIIDIFTIINHHPDAIHCYHSCHILCLARSTKKRQTFTDFTLNFFFIRPSRLLTHILRTVPFTYIPCNLFTMVSTGLSRS